MGTPQHGNPEKDIFGRKAVESFCDYRFVDNLNKDIIFEWIRNKDVINENFQKAYRARIAQSESGRRTTSGIPHPKK